MDLRESFWNLLTRNKDTAPAAVLEQVRGAMLDVVERVGDDRHIRLDVRIQLARDLATLWYLRPDVMEMVAATEGEAAARTCLDQVTARFGAYHLAGNGYKAKALAGRAHSA